MKKQVFVLKYNNGDYVKRDDSTGPMSTGGYPFPVKTVEEATKWDTQEAAARYGNTSGFRDFIRAVFPLEIDYLELAMIPFPEKWERCNHHCIDTKESTAPNAQHFLDCPIVTGMRNE